uniref:Uncharacterized protein n=1 Tax=Nelumbo nucifera TaxID=4432 RepID=A0A822XIY9_NELNU|nr:TPA_asm: hypothetical protein HUJ06_020198 [Nelumbo nucifera]
MHVKLLFFKANNFKKDKSIAVPVLVPWQKLLPTLPLLHKYSNSCLESVFFSNTEG